MIINGATLLLKSPIEYMFGEKRREHGVSYGLSEAGYDIRIKQQITLSKENKFSLASTVERFQMPSDLVGIVHDKSTWARRGLSVFNTVIEPGWHGWLTLELVYHGNDELIIPAGAGIAQVLFHQVINDAAYSGKYQGQDDMPVEARHD
jgi:dCTP deaminase